MKLIAAFDEAQIKAESRRNLGIKQVVQVLMCEKIVVGTRGTQSLHKFYYSCSPRNKHRAAAGCAEKAP
jgi:hypothetical protein